PDLVILRVASRRSRSSAGDLRGFRTGDTKMKIKRSMALTALVSAATLVLAACGGGSGDDEASDTVKIGVVLPFTGVQATIAKLEGQGAEVAAKEINDAGGIDGKWKIELVDVDDQLDPAQCHGHSSTE